MWTHEMSYQGWGIRPRIHRARLATIFSLFEGFDLPPRGRMADFGCSNGFILGELQERFFQDKEWEFHGYDHAAPLIQAARERRLSHTHFDTIDMTLPLEELHAHFDLVMCLETLEHTSDAHAALMNLYHVTRPGGTLLVSVPNEKGAQGLVKLVSRPLMYKDPYGDFFAGKSRLKYVWHLLSDRPIDSFRGHSPDGWGPHLGFDWKVFEAFLHRELVDTGRCELVRRTSSFLDFNLFYQLRRVR